MSSAKTGSGTHDACLTPTVADLSPTVADRPRSLQACGKPAVGKVRRACAGRILCKQSASATTSETAWLSHDTLGDRSATVGVRHARCVPDPVVAGTHVARQTPYVHAYGD